MGDRAQASIPLIDLGRYGDAQSLAPALHDAASSLGFLQLASTGLEPAALRMFEISREFFKTSPEEKAKYPITNGNCGYSQIGQELLDPSKPNETDLKESTSLLLHRKTLAHAVLDRIFMFSFVDSKGQAKQALPPSLARHLPEIAAFQIASAAL